METLRLAICLARPRQWVKNLFVFAPLLFSGLLFDRGALLRTVVASVAFCLASSSVYIVNDMVDRERDRNHPEKCKRPLASGRLSMSAATVTLAVCLTAAVGLALLPGSSFLGVVLGYLALNVAYSFKLKHLPIIDVMSVACGFVPRVVGGVVAVDCYLSPWIICCTFLLALFLATQKRYGELDGSDDEEPASRDVLHFYNKELLGEMVSTCVSLTIMSYSLYTFSEASTKLMMITIPFVIYGMFRYQMLAKIFGGVERPEKILFADKPILVDVVLWVITCAAILYVVQ